jgi:O-antigen/teichoic acid export membrane protein
MNMLGRTVGNGAVMLASQLATWTATLVLTAALGRYLGAGAFGELYLALALAAIFGLLVGFGLDDQLVRAIARDPSLSGSYVSAAVALKVALAVAGYILLLGVSRLLAYSTNLQYLIALYGLVLLSNGLSLTLSAVYRGSQRLAHVAISTVIEKVLVASISLVLLIGGYGVVEIAAVMVIGDAVGAIWKAVFLPKVARVTWTLTPGAFRVLLVGAPPFILYAIFGALYFRIDTVLLSKLTDSVVVGWYGAAYRLFDTMVFLPAIVASTLMFPIFAQLSRRSRSELNAAIGEGLKVMLIAGAPLAAGLCVLAQPIVAFIYGGSEFGGTPDALRWLAPGLFVLYLNSILKVAIVSLNLERRLVIVALVAAVFNLAANLVLIPRFQHVGAAAVTSLTEVAVFSYLLVSLPRDLIPWRSLRIAARALGASAVMVGVLQILAGQHVVVLVVAGALTYAACSVAVGLISLDDLASMRRALVRPSHSPDGLAPAE